MIVVDHQASLVTVNVYGEFTLADYREFEELVNYKVRFEGEVNLLFDLREMNGLTVDVAWEEVKFARQHANDFGRVAILTQSEWVKWSAWLAQVFVNAEVKFFDEVVQAHAWVSVPA